MGILHSLTILAIGTSTIFPSSSAKLSQNSSILMSFKPVKESIDLSPKSTPAPTPKPVAIVYTYIPPTRLASDPTPTPVSSPTPQVTPSVLNDTQINFLGSCESGMTATRNSGNGYYGAFQFSYGTWQSMGTGFERADLAPLDVQKEAVQRLVARSSVFSQFPGCSAQMRAEGLL